MPETTGTDWQQIKSAQRLGAGSNGQSCDGTFTAGNLPEYSVSAGDGTLGDSGIPASNVALISKVQQEAYVYAADTGTANAYAVTLSPPPTIVAGSEVVFKAANANTGVSTLSVNGTSYPLTKNGAAALTGGEISAGQVITAKFDGTNFQISNAQTTVVNSQVLSPIIGSVAGQGKSYFAGTGALPSNWQTVGFSDSAWNTPAVETGSTPGTPYAGTQWITDPTANGNQAQSVVTLFRYSFNLNGTSLGTLQVGADNGLMAVYLNGTQIYSNTTPPTGFGNFSGTINITAAMLVVGSNLLAFEIQNSTNVGSSPTSLDFLLSLYGGASGTGITLETNGVLNGSQNLLNLVAGSNITVTDDGSGDVMIAATTSGSAGTVTHTAGSLTSGQLIVGNGSADIKTGDLSGDVTTSGSTVTALATSGVTAGTYTDATITVDAKGRVTAASSGAGGSGASSTPPYITIGGTKFFPANMYAVTLPSVAGWSALASGSGSISAGANGQINITHSANTDFWAYSGVLSSFTQAEFILGYNELGNNNSGPAADWQGLYVYDSANSQIRGMGPQNTFGTTRLDTYNGSWSGSTASNPSGVSFGYVSQTNYINVPLVLRIAADSGTKTITYSISPDGGQNFYTLTTEGPFTNAPTLVGILVRTITGITTIYSLKTT
jgi:hypothetical protein